MLNSRKRAMTLYVDKLSQKWVVLDPDGNFWIVQSTDEKPWDGRQPFSPSDETELQPVPGHYKSLIGLPF